ncbi:MAG: hypothetical protein FWE37_07385 [Spirochaetaceae bacterium]|nr:hypothetical protein [Spirochaetaceae bacterium]
MQKILIIALLLIAINAQGQGLPVPANATLASLFPDENLRVSVAGLLEADANLIGQALSDALAGIEVLRARYRGIKDSTGIEYLIGLINLDLWGNQLINFSGNSLINLQELWLHGNPLTKIDVSNNINLIELGISGTELVAIDLNNLINLQRLVAASNRQLTSLDVSNLINLISLDLRYTGIPVINISNLTKLTYYFVEVSPVLLGADNAPNLTVIITQ